MLCNLGEQGTPQLLANLFCQKTLRNQPPPGPQTVSRNPAPCLSALRPEAATQMAHQIQAPTAFAVPQLPLPGAPPNLAGAPGASRPPDLISEETKGTVRDHPRRTEPPPRHKSLCGPVHGTLPTCPPFKSLRPKSLALQQHPVF